MIFLPMEQIKADMKSLHDLRREKHQELRDEYAVLELMPEWLDRFKRRFYLIDSIAEADREIEQLWHDLGLDGFFSALDQIVYDEAMAQRIMERMA